MLHKQFAMLWKFLGFFQDPYTRSLHVLIVGLVSLQLLGGSMLTYAIYTWPSLGNIPLWGHVGGGLLTLCITLLLTANSLRKRGLAHFFPYLFGNMAQLEKDIRDSLQFKVVGPRPGGLASSVQGLGLGALLLTVCSGFMWLVARTTDLMPPYIFIEVHGVAALLLLVYFGGHGTMGLLHFVLWQKKTKSKSK